MRNRLTQDTPTLFLDQYGNRLWATSREELVRQAGAGRVFKVYRDTKSKGSVWVGYGVGERWFSAYKPVQLKP